MQVYDRRGFFQFATAAAAGAVAGQLFAGAPVDPPKDAFRLGLLAGAWDNLEQVIAHVCELGLPTAHVSMREFSDDMAPRLRSALDRYEVEATVFISSGPGGNITIWSRAHSSAGWSPPGIGEKELTI